MRPGNMGLPAGGEQMIAKVSGSVCRIVNAEKLTAGSVGAYHITVQLSEQWRELAVTAVFAAFEVLIDDVMDEVACHSFIFFSCCKCHIMPPSSISLYF